MKKLMQMVMALALSQVAAVLGSFAADPVTVNGEFRPGTVAFYLFNELEPGNSLVGTPVLNAVDNTRFGGTSDIFEQEGYENTAACETSAERPGKYVFDGLAFGAAPLLTNPRSVYFVGANGTRSSSPTYAVYSGGRIQFADLATEMLSNVEYTIEFFYMIPQSIPAYDGTAALWKPTSSNYGPGIWAPAHYSGANTMRRALIHTSASASKYCEYPESLADGQWHHVAAVRSGGKLRLFCDYVNRTDVLTDNSVVAEALPLILSPDYKFRGHISCLRVMTKALTPAQMLHAAESVDFLKPTVFHWTMDGESGATASVMTNGAPVNLADFAGQYLTNYLATAGNGALTSADSPVVYTNDLPDCRRKGVKAGGTLIHENVTAGLLPVTEAGSTSLVLPTSSVPAAPVDSGSFTFETFFRFAPSWMEGWTGKANTRCALAHRPSDAVSKRPADWWCGFADYGDGIMVAKVSTSAATPASATASESVNVSYVTSVPFDFQWHHYAFVYDEEKLTISLYLDHKRVAKANLSSPIVRLGSSTGDCLFVGKSGANPGFTYKPFEGELDEVRYSCVALEPEDFLQMKSTGGMMIIFR